MDGSVRTLAGRRLFAAAILCAATGASGQLVVYKHTDPAGNVLYSDSTNNSSASLPASQEAAPEADAKPAPNRRIVSKRSLQVNVSEAQRRLSQAELKRKQGRAPLPSERVQGSGEVTYAYWRRQEKLRIEVEQAQRRTNAVQRPLLAVSGGAAPRP